MRTFVQLKDGVGFAVVNTEGYTEGIEVDPGAGEQYLHKTYADGVWSDASLIWYAEINYNGSIMEIKKTYFSSEVGENPIFSFDISPTARWVNNEWVDSEILSIGGDIDGAGDSI
jgi:hypothetical protein